MLESAGHDRVTATKPYQLYTFDPSLSDPGMTNPCNTIMLPITGMTNMRIMIYDNAAQVAAISNQVLLFADNVMQPMKQFAQGACPI